MRCCTRVAHPFLRGARARRDEEIAKEITNYLLSGEGEEPDTYTMYKKVERYGLPLGGGWADQPEAFMRDLDAVQTALDNVAYIRAVNAKQQQQQAPRISGGKNYG